MRSKFIDLYKNYIHEIWLFIIVFFFHMMLNPLLPHISSLPTETLSKAAAAYFSGKNWESLMVGSDYYGTGFYIILTPIYCLTNHAVIIRQFTLGLVVLLVSFQAVICYKIMTCFLKVESKRFAQFLSAGLSFLPVVRSNMALNEPPLEFIMWIIVYLLLDNLNQVPKKKLYTNSIIIGMLLGYSRTVHERALTFLAATIITVFFFHIVFQKKSVSYVFFGGSLIVSLILSEVYNSFAYNILWGGQEIKNTVAAAGSKSFNAVKLLFSENGVKAAFHILFGEIFTANVYTCGLFLLSILLFFRLSFYIIGNKVKKDNMQFINEYYIIFIFALCICATIGIMALQTLNGAIIAYNESIAAKSYCYLRYFFIYYPPICMVSFLFLYKRKIKKKEIYISLILMMLLSKYVVSYFAPVINNNPSLQLDRFHYLSPFSFRKPDEALTMIQLALCIEVCFVIYLLMLLCIRKYKTIIAISFIIALFVYEYVYSVFGFSSYFMNSYYAYINSFCEKVYCNEIMEAVDSVYVVSANASYMAAMEMPDMDIRKGFPDSITERMLILAPTTENNVTQFDTLYRITLDENEFLYFSDTDLYKKFDEAGYKIVFLQP